MLSELHDHRFPTSNIAALSTFWWARNAPLLDLDKRCVDPSTRPPGHRQWLTDDLPGAAKTSISFAGQVVHRPQYKVLHRHGRASEHVLRGGPSMVGYLDYGYVNGDRMRLFEVCPDPRGRLNRVGAAIANKRLAQITPPEWTEDSYFVCLLLALAQLQERKAQPPEPDITSYTSRLLVTGTRDHEYIHLYDAEITAELLKALTYPKLATACIEWPLIRRRQIAFQPYDTFADHLTAALVAPMSLCLAKSTAPSEIHGTKRGPKHESSRGEAAALAPTAVNVLHSLKWVFSHGDARSFMLCGRGRILSRRFVFGPVRSDPMQRESSP